MFDRWPFHASMCLVRLAERFLQWLMMRLHLRMDYWLRVQLHHNSLDLYWFVSLAVLMMYSANHWQTLLKCSYNWSGLWDLRMKFQHCSHLWMSDSRLPSLPPPAQPTIVNRPTHKCRRMLCRTNEPMQQSWIRPTIALLATIQIHNRLEWMDFWNNIDFTPSYSRQGRMDFIKNYY